MPSEPAVPRRSWRTRLVGKTASSIQYGNARLQRAVEEEVDPLDVVLDRQSPEAGTERQNLERGYALYAPSRGRCSDHQPRGYVRVSGFAYGGTLMSRFNGSVTNGTGADQTPPRDTSTVGFIMWARSEGGHYWTCIHPGEKRVG